MFKIKKLLQFKKNIKNIVLEKGQKDEIRNHLLSYISLHPVREKADLRLKSQNRGNILFFNTEHMYAKLATLLVLLSGTGTAFAAENTVPGDSLYGVKVHINEPVRAALSVSSQAKADWDAKVAERRLDEASKLASEGKLSAELEAKLEARFSEQTEKLKNRISKLKEDGKIDAASNLSTRLESALQIHSQILDKLGEEGTTKQEIKPLLKQLKEEVKSVQEIKTKLNEDIREKIKTEGKTPAENHMRVAEKQIANVSAFLESKEIAVTSSAWGKIEASKKAFAEGKAQFDAENYGAAFLLFGTAQKLAAEAKVMIHVQTDLKIDDRIHKIFERLDDREVELTDKQKEKIEDKVKEKFEDRREKHKEKREDQKEDEQEDSRDEKDEKVEIELHRSETLDTL